MTRARVHRSLLLLSLVLFVTGIPFCRPLMSFGLILISANWLAEGDFKRKWQQIKRNRILWACLLIYIVHLAGLTYSSNLAYAWNDLVIKLPLLLLPLIFATTRPLDNEEWRRLLAVYLFATCTSAAIGLVHFLTHPEITDKREIAMHISYIRFELNLCFGFFVGIYLLRSRNKAKNGTPTLILTLTAILWLTAIQLYIGALTAIALAFCCITILLLVTAFRSKSRPLRIGVTLLLAAVTAGILLLATTTFRQYTHISATASAATSTANGHPYASPIEKNYIENGSYVYGCLCEEELSSAWGKRSRLPYDGWTADGDHTVRNTLIRYMNSKGLTKDSLGMEQLTDKDINFIENGKASIRYTRSGLEARYFETLWDISLYFRCNEVEGSMPRRFEMWRISRIASTRHPLIGTGTGDVKDAVADELVWQDSPVQGYLIRSHNQYLSFAIAFGWIGLAIILFSLFYPPIATGKYKRGLYLAFLIIYMVSMFTDDPMERQDGVTLFAFFNSLFLFLEPDSGTQ